jgi:hypothetical protein
MTELIDVRADAVAPGETICLGGATILVTGVETRGRVVDLHTEYGPALRMLRTETVAVTVDAAAGVDAA